MQTSIQPLNPFLPDSKVRLRRRLKPQLLTVCLLLSATFALGVCQAEVKNLRCEYLVNPLGIGTAQPRLSWDITSSRRGEKQTAYQILAASSQELLDKGDLWDSGKVDSDQTIQIPYSGHPLSSRQNCFWKVRVWDGDGTRGHWSQAAFWQVGLLQSNDWSAQWIFAEPAVAVSNERLKIQRAVYGAVESDQGLDVTSKLNDYVKENQLMLVVNNRTLGQDPARNQVKRLRVEYELAGQPRVIEVSENESLVLPHRQARLPFFRKSFEVDRPVKSAILYATALGLYEFHINGTRVGDHVLAPDWTDYRKRVRYQVYDVTSLIKKGPNAIASLLANGWYSGHIGNGGYQYFGKTPALLAQLEIAYADGQSQRIVTDETWKTGSSPIVSSDFMKGEEYDARLKVAGWDQPGYDEGGCSSCKSRTEPNLELDAQVMEPVRKLAELKPKSVKEVKPGSWVFDLGQNMVGVVRLKVSAPSGTKITLRHAEMLNPDGTLYTRNLRSASSVDHYTCEGTGVETWEPQFTFHGFRYVELSGLGSKPSLDMVTGIVLGTDLPPSGEFSCSDPRINQLQSNIQWGQRGNYVSVPTDCPQRDERLGWMGDAQVFVRTATYNSDVAAFFNKWLVDVDDGQTAEGSFSDVSPNTMGANSVPAWGDAGVICPWTIYDAYADKEILGKHLPAMIKWVEYLRLHSEDLIRSKNRGNDYGDWLSIGANTPKDLIGTAFFAYSTHLVAKSCAALGRDAEASKYESLFQDIKTAFNKRYVAPDGRIQGNTQTAYALALKFELLPEELRQKAADYLEQDIQAKGEHLSTGFIGVGYLLPVLTQYGKTETAYQLLQQDTFPSWLFSVKHGATTIWERWDGWTPEKGFQDPGMNSFNHYSLGSCGEYLFGYVGGIRPASPGFKTILIDPTIANGLTWARTSYNSIHGQIATSWKLQNHKLSLEVTIPANTTATVCVPAKDAAAVTEGGKPAAKANQVRFVRMEHDKAVFEVGSGKYSFGSEI